MKWIVILLLPSCATSQFEELSSAGAKVRIYQQRLSNDCTHNGQIIITHKNSKWGRTQQRDDKMKESAINGLKNEAADRGADSVVITKQTIDKGYIEIIAEAYECLKD